MEATKPYIKEEEKPDYSTLDVYARQKIDSDENR